MPNHATRQDQDQDFHSRNAPSTSFRQMPSFLPYTYDLIMNAGLKYAADDILKESVTLRTCFSVPKKTTFIKKMLNTQLPSINQFQKDPVISAATAQPPEVIGENLNCFQKLNTPTDIDTVVPVNRKTVNFNSKCLKESHVKDSSIPNLTTPCFVLLEKLNFTPPESELKKFKSAANTTTIKKAPSKRKPKKKLKSAANATTIKKAPSNSQHKKKSKSAANTATIKKKKKGLML
ncbi:hypothetical protein TNCV_1872081 [Trichonephila clavipes]|nr:hypothetical protein TNCV_1872081 [Trichonephila clavipes]